ncbi:hypothetical protein COLO4_31517 [Corchorus olitorius]|uniref:Vacuolar protein sorting-associated protein Ist1 n=1 Tax=Corchorus olitorius TaxID=93759 RepID=A0A1R3H483_9ROSI|nr:hypothetical protein COLO4_31517 [Corchorus olitorius]
MLGVLFRWRKASKCKKLVRRVQCRLKFLKIKRRSIINQLHEDIVNLLRNGHPQTAFSHAEELIKYQNLSTAYDLLEKFCEFIILHLPYIRKHKNCPNDIKEAVSTLIFAAAWCGDLPELQTIRKLFKERYGSKFIQRITEPNPENHVNSQVKEKLCLKYITDDMKQSLIVELAKEHGFQPQHPGSNKRLGSNVLVICGNNNLHWEGFLFEIGKSVQVEHRYGTKMICNKSLGNASLESFGSESEFLFEVEEIQANTIQNNYGGDKTVFLFNYSTSTDDVLSETENGFSGARLLVSSQICAETNIFAQQSYSRSIIPAPERVNRHVHPNLPDYDELVAKFKTLKQEQQQKGVALM